MSCQKGLLWFNPSWQLSPTQLLAYSPPVGWGRIQRIEVRKHREIKAWVTRETKAMNASETEQGINSPIHMGMQLFSHSQESKAPSGITATWEDKGHHSKGVSPFPSSPDFYIAEHNVLWNGTSLRSLQPALPSKSPCAPPVSWLAGGWDEEQKRPWFCCVSVQQ